jgi:HPt (histidine-containing phosphotransfer) domain-containing protein
MFEMPDGTEEFDESRFNFILDLAGPHTARTLTMRLDEDLTRISETIARAAASADRHLLKAQTHNLLGIAGTVGANQLYRLSEHLNGLIDSYESGPLADCVAEIHALLDRLILRIRSVRDQLAGKI